MPPPAGGNSPQPSAEREPPIWAVSAALGCLRRLRPIGAICARHTWPAPGSAGARGASHRLNRPGESRGPRGTPGWFTTAGWPRSAASKIASWPSSAVVTTCLSAERNSQGMSLALLAGDERRRAEGDLLAAQAHAVSASCLDVPVPVRLTPEVQADDHGLPGAERTGVWRTMPDLRFVCSGSQAGHDRPCAGSGC